MKRIAAIILCYVILFSLAPMAIVGAETTGTAYYVSPNGSDSNPGTEELPWATMYKAAQTLTAGDTAIFEDGTYNETRYTEFANAGTADAPITLKARNQHKAVIMYDEALRLQKLNVLKSYINIRDFAITQEVASTAESERPTLDILLRCGYSKLDQIVGCEFTGNRFYNVYEEGIKVQNAKDILVKDNIIENPGHEGMDIFGCDAVTICGNEVINAGRTGYMIKGNSRNCLIYNNLVKNDTASCYQGYLIGGQSDSTSPYVVAKDVGYEAYNCVIYNNIATASSQTLMETGVAFSGAKDCHAYNNVISGAESGFSISNAPDERKGWGWDPPTVNPKFYNNIMMNVANAFYFANTAEGFVSDNNLYYNVSNTSSIQNEPNGLKTNPQLTSDWHLAESSPARKAGMTVPASVSGYPGIEGYDEIDPDRIVEIDLVDFSGEARQTPWDIGVYNRGEESTGFIINEDFEGNTAGDDIVPSAAVCYNGWSGVTLAADKSIKFWAEPAVTEGQPSSNMAANFTAVSPSTVGATEGYMYHMRYDMNTINDGYVNFRYRFRANSIVTGEVFNTLICGLTYSTIPETSATLNGSINSDGSSLTAGKWYDYDIYIDVINKKMTVFVDGELIGSKGQTMSGAGDLSRIQMGFSRKTTTADSDVVIDDIVLKKIDEDTYYETTGVLPPNVVLSEDFTGGVAGSAFPRGSETAPSWNDLYSLYSANTKINFAADPENLANSVVEFVKTAKAEVNKWYYVGRRFGKNNSSGILTEGVYSVSFRLRSTDVDGTIFQLNVWDGTNSTPIDFDFNTDKVTVHSWDYVDGVKTPNAKTADYVLDHNKWYDVKVLYDLGGESVAATVSINGQTLISGAYLYYGGKYNDGEIGEIAWLINNRGDASILDEATEDNTVFASFMIDDIVMKDISVDITDITVSENQVTGLSAYVGEVPTASQKFIVAVYGEDANGDTKLKDVTFATTSKVGTHNITLTDTVSVSSGDVVKAYYWDLTTLAPLGTMCTKIV